MQCVSTLSIRMLFDELLFLQNSLFSMPSHCQRFPIYEFVEAFGDTDTLTDTLRLHQIQLGNAWKGHPMCRNKGDSNTDLAGRVTCATKLLQGVLQKDQHPAKTPFRVIKTLAKRHGYKGHDSSGISTTISQRVYRMRIPGSWRTVAIEGRRKKRHVLLPLALRGSIQLRCYSLHDKLWTL